MNIVGNITSQTTNNLAVVRRPVQLQPCWAPEVQRSPWWQGWRSFGRGRSTNAATCEDEFYLLGSAISQVISVPPGGAISKPSISLVLFSYQSRLPSSSEWEEAISLPCWIFMSSYISPAYTVCQTCSASAVAIHYTKAILARSESLLLMGRGCLHSSPALPFTDGLSYKQSLGQLNDDGTCKSYILWATKLTTRTINFGFYRRQFI